MVRKIRYKRLIAFFAVLIVAIIIILGILNLKVTNIYVTGNEFLTEQEIIELAHLENYPRIITVIGKVIESKIKANPYIESVKVKKHITTIYINIKENRPLLYDEKNNRTILKNGKYTNDHFSTPILTTSVNEEIYNQFLEKLSLIELPVFNVISEIKYAPNDVDDKLFLFTMNDGNYVYINLEKFENINKYFDMVVKFNNHKGILYLDSGEYFKIYDN